MEERVIRPFVRGRDEQAWIELYNAYYGHYYGRELEPAPEDDVAWWENTPWWRDTRIFMAELAGEPVGFVVASMSVNLPEPAFKRGFINSIGVLKPFRRMGVGTTIMSAAVSWLASKGVEVVELGVDNENPTDAPAFYGRLGFRAAFKHLAFSKELRA